MLNDVPLWLQSSPTKYDALPVVMRNAKRWLVWCLEPNKDPLKKRRKVPYYVNGRRRAGVLDSPQDVANLASFSEALAALQSGGFTGLGFALGPDGSGNHWQGVDFDDMPNRPALQTLAAQLLGYTETSPSANGMHAIGYGRPFATLGSNASGIEAYAQGRFFTVTAEGAGLFPPECLADFVEATLSPLHAIASKGTRIAGYASAQTDETVSDETVSDLRNALFHMSADDRDLWIRMGMALKVLGGRGREIWIEWSTTSTKFDADTDPDAWDTLRPERTGFKAVFAEAQRQGWANPRRHKEALLDGFRSIANTERWPEPTPLPNPLPPVDAFDEELLPVALRPWVMDIAHRMQCPVDFPAVAALVGLSSLIGARAVIQPKAHDDWQVVPNLWAAVVGRAGVKKSPALSEALKPLHRLQASEIELWQAAHAAWQLDSKVADMQAEGNERKAKGLATNDPGAARALLAPVDTPTEPIARRFVVNDATVEKLGEIMQHNEWGTLSYRDELYGLLTSLDKQGQEGSRAFYLQSYDGNQGYTFDRIGRGTVHIPRVCLAMIGGIQPGRIQEYVRGAVAGGSGDDGLLQRFGLLVWPDVTSEYVHVDQWPDTPAKQTAWAVFDRLAELQPASDIDPAIWRFEDAAQAAFVEWLVPFEMEIRREDLHPAMVSHLSKYRKLIPALALLFALIDTPDSGFIVRENELRRALRWCAYLRTHANRLYAAAVMPETTGAATLLSKIRCGKLHDADGAILESFTPRQVAIKGWTGLGTPDVVRKAADVLADFDWLRLDEVPTSAAGGRPSDRYIVNPAALKSR
jgi:hypothetical protein